MVECDENKSGLWNGEDSGEELSDEKSSGVKQSGDWEEYEKSEENSSGEWQVKSSQGESDIDEIRYISTVSASDTSCDDMTIGISGASDDIEINIINWKKI